MRLIKHQGRAYDIVCVCSCEKRSIWQNLTFHILTLTHVCIYLLLNLSALNLENVEAMRHADYPDSIEELCKLN